MAVQGRDRRVCQDGGTDFEKVLGTVDFKGQ